MYRWFFFCGSIFLVAYLLLKSFVLSASILGLPAEFLYIDIWSFWSLVDPPNRPHYSYYFFWNGQVLLMSKTSSNVPVISNKNPEQSTGKEKKEQRKQSWLYYTRNSINCNWVHYTLSIPFYSESVSAKNDLIWPTGLSSSVHHSVPLFLLVSASEEAGNLSVI